MLEDALARYGYVVLFIGSGLEGDAVLGAAAFLAQQGKLNPLWTYLIAVAGSATAGEVSFRLGRRHGAGWIEERAGDSPNIGRVQRWIAERGRLLVFFSRFLWGLRLTIPAVCGASRMPSVRFSVWNLTGAAVWAAVVGAGAYFFGALLERLWDDYSQHLGLVASGVFILLFSIYLWRGDQLAWGVIVKPIQEKRKARRHDGARVYAIEASPVGEAHPGPSLDSVFQREYDFTGGEDWFSRNVPVWKRALEPLQGRPGLRYLEIGSAEGRSLIWLFENVLTDPSCQAVCIDPFHHGPGSRGNEGEVIDAFLANIGKAGVEKQVTVIRGYSEIELRKLRLDEPFDLIYVDGNHRAKPVLEDLVLAWRLLKPEGLLIAAGYEWMPDADLADRPMMAIDFFVKAYEEELEVVHRRYQVILRKASAEKLERLAKH